MSISTVDLLNADRPIRCSIGPAALGLELVVVSRSWHAAPSRAHRLLTISVANKKQAKEKEIDSQCLYQAGIRVIGASSNRWIDAYRFLLACEMAWCAEYEANAWYTNDPWLNYARTSTTPARGRDIAAHSKPQSEIVAMAQRYGFMDALIVPAPSSGNITRTGVLCLGASHPSFFEGDGFMTLRLQARALAMELHEWWIAHIGQELIQQARLSDSDLTLLRLERQGQCTKLIADALDTSVHAINSRFQRMTEKLGVPNRKAAAHLAAEYGLI